jgi:hypothetical protein
LLGGKLKRLVKVPGQGGEDRIVREAFENFREVGDPKGTLEAGTNFLETFGDAQAGLLGRRAVWERRGQKTRPTGMARWN